MSLYRLLVGKHIGQGPSGCKCEHCVDGNTGWHVYRSGDIIDTKINLLEFNQPPRSMKYELVDEKGRVVHATPVPTAPPQTVPTPRDGLESMSKQELVSLAAEEEIDLGAATRKEEIIQTIRAATSAQEPVNV